jgi:hypothetical protein
MVEPQRTAATRSPTALVLHLQRIAGNDAVSKALRALEGNGAPDGAMATGGAASTSELGSRRRDALAEAAARGGNSARERRRRRPPEAESQEAIATQNWKKLAQLLSDDAPEEGDWRVWVEMTPWVHALYDLTVDQLCASTT